MQCITAVMLQQGRQNNLLLSHHLSPNIFLLLNVHKFDLTVQKSSKLVKTFFSTMKKPCCYQMVGIIFFGSLHISLSYSASYNTVINEILLQEMISFVTRLTAASTQDNRFLLESVHTTSILYG